jgi:hypothetical protein
MKMKFPATVIGLGAVREEIMPPPDIFEISLRVNNGVYLAVMANVVRPWMDEVTDERPYAW